MRVHASALVLLAAIAAKPVGAVTRDELGEKRGGVVEGQPSHEKEGGAGIRGMMASDRVEADFASSELCNNQTSPKITCPASLTGMDALTANAGCSATHGEPSPQIDEEHCGVKEEDVMCRVDNNSTNPNILGFDCGFGTPDGPCFVNDTMTTYGGGTTSITCTVMDLGGANDTASCTFEVEVNDETDPVITCPPNETISTNEGMCVGDFDGMATATDNCDGDGNVVITRDPENPVGPPLNVPIPITFTATDDAGNTDTCTTYATVNDNEPPVVTCDGAVKRIADLDECVATGYDDTVAATENCGPFTLDVDSMANYTKGETNITHTATDESGNEGTCTTTVTVVDQESPTIRCETCGDYDAATELFYAEDNCAVTKVSCTDGTNTIEWTGDDELANATLAGSGDFTGTPFSFLSGDVTCTAEDESGNEATCDTDLNGPCRGPTDLGASILFCFDYQGADPNMTSRIWDRYFAARGYAPPTMVSVRTDPAPFGDWMDCGDEVADPTKDWDAVILAKSSSVSFTGVVPNPEPLYPIIESWANNNTLKPLILHDWNAPTQVFWGDFAIQFESGVESYSTVTPSAGGILAGLGPITLGNPPGAIDATSPDGGPSGTEEARHDDGVGGTAIARNGFVWGVGPKVDTFDPLEDTLNFQYLDRMLCCNDCAAYTPLNP